MTPFCTFVVVAVFSWGKTSRTSTADRMGTDADEGGGVLSLGSRRQFNISRPSGGDNGVLHGRKPYRLLDETRRDHGATRLRGLVLLPLLCLIVGTLVLARELGLGGDNVEDRDVRDMAWDYRVTLAASTAFHAYFRRVYWSTYYAMNDAGGVFREVVLPAVDRPVHPKP